MFYRYPILLCSTIILGGVFLIPVIFSCWRAIYVVWVLFLISVIFNDTFTLF